MTRHIFTLCILVCMSVSGALYAQRVGVLTNNPQAPFHVASSGQVNTPGGLMVLGSTVEAHLEVDFNILQSKFGAGTLPLQIQPEGGNLQIGVTLMHLNAGTGFVGIGTNSPARKLDIQGSADQYLRIHTTSAGTSAAGIELIRSSEFSGTDWRITNEGGTLRFYDAINNFNGPADLNMTMTSSGNVGIGTDGPQSRLHVAGADDQFIKVQRTTAGTGMAGIDLLRASEFSATDWRIVNDGGILKFLDATDNFLSGSGDLNMVITQAGNVGIGTESPQAPLHVLGTQLVNETGSGFFQVGTPNGLHLRFDNNEILARNGDNPSTLFLQFWSGNLSLVNNPSGRVGVGTTAPQSKMHITGGTEVTLGGGGELVLGATTSANLAMDGNEIQARNNGSASALFLQPEGGDVLLVPFETGQVGIGVINSANMPSDQYLLAVDGRVICEEVRVEISEAWPDYVFTKDYALTPLPELEKLIAEHGHLPGIPSAATIESEGFDLGDMQRRMVEKVEELTLYVIALQKEIDALKSKKKRR